MLQSDFGVLTGVDDGFGKRRLAELQPEERNEPYNWINQALLAFIILCVTGAIAFGVFYLLPSALLGMK